jgi:hypothetical protein
MHNMVPFMGHFARLAKAALSAELGIWSQRSTAARVAVRAC